MKARLHPTPAMKKAIDAYAEAKIQGIQCRAQEAVMKERAGILPAPQGCRRFEKKQETRHASLPEENHKTH